MSSHREAPSIAKDPVADSTDLYAFVSPDKPDTVTMIANYVPLQLPPGGPNFYEFGDDVLYEILIDNNHDGLAEITYQFQFTTTLQDPDTFLYNTGQITSITDPTWNRRQHFSVTKVDTAGASSLLGSDLACPPCNVGVRSIPNYQPIGASANHTISGGVKAFAGQRAEGFYVDLGSIFDLGALRPFQNLHLIPLPAAPGVNAPAIVNVHSIVIQVPITDLTANGSMPTSVTDPNAVLGIWTTASRQMSTVIGPGGGESGPWVQVSRLGNPLINEVMIPMGMKDQWNSQAPVNDSDFLSDYQHPMLSGLLPVLYPKVFPNLAKLTAARDDIVAILLTGLPSGVIKGFQNSTGSGYYDLLRLNVAIKPASKPSLLGILGGDLAGFPNGRRVFDDVVSIELRALAGLTYPLVAPTYKPDKAAGEIYDLENPATTDPAGLLSSVGVQFWPNFPYMYRPHSGFSVPSKTP